MSYYIFLFEFCFHLTSDARRIYRHNLNDWHMAHSGILAMVLTLRGLISTSQLQNFNLGANKNLTPLPLPRPPPFWGPL